MSNLSSKDECVVAFENKDHAVALQLLPSLQKHSDVKCNLANGTAHLIHCAAANGWNGIVRLLVTEFNCNPQQKDSEGRTAVHFASAQGHLDIVQYLVGKHSCSATDTDSSGRTPLHEAARGGHLDVAQYLVGDCGCSAVARDSGGRMPLHEAARGGCLGILKYLIHQCNCSVTDTDSSGCTPLHVAAWYGRLNVVKHLVGECGCSVSDRSNIGHTPLHMAAQDGHLAVVMYLVECGGDIIATDIIGATPFHSACQWNYGNRNILVIQYFLSKPIVLNMLNKDTSNSSLLSDAKGDAVAMYDKFKHIQTSHPVGSFVNIFLLGNPGAGKTTLCEAIKKRTKTFTESVHDVFLTRKVKNVKLSTAGIIPNKLWDETLGNVIIHDFAGQPEYYASHAAVLESLLQDFGAIFIVVINLTQNLSQQIQLWSSIIINECMKVSSNCHLIIIGSHGDEVKNELQQQKMNQVESQIKKELSCSIASILSLDCRLCSKDSLQPLVEVLSSLCTSIRNKQSPAISLYSNFLYSILGAKVSENACTLEELISLCNQSRQEGVPVPDDIVPLLKTLHCSGLIVYLENKHNLMKSWVVTSKEVLLFEVNGTLFAPSSFVEHRDIASNTGIITGSALQQLFPQYSLSMLIAFLKSMKLCEELKKEVFGVKNISSTNASDQLLFFPALIAKERPQDITGNFTFGWCFKASGASFSARFFHLLQLQFAYQYSRSVSNASQLLPPGLERQCSVWINGIHWYNDDGVETLIEQTEGNQSVVMLMSCQERAEEKMIQLHCKLVKNITHLQQEYCPILQCEEYLLEPGLEYPLDEHSPAACYAMERLRSRIGEGETSILGEAPNTPAVKIAELLPIKPMKYLQIYEVSLYSHSAV